MRTVEKAVYFWTRDLHLYLGLFVSPFILVFAISTLFLNHNWRPSGSAKRQIRSAPIEIPQGPGSIEQAKEILRQLNLSGEIGFIRFVPKDNRLSISLMKPGVEATIEVDLESKTAEVDERETGIWQTLIYLHRSPGPHNAGIRGNWIYTRIWRGMADSVVYLLLFSSASGIYLWLVIKAARRFGFILIALGTVSFFAVLAALSA